MIAVGTLVWLWLFAGGMICQLIGVPMAAYHSYEAWAASGEAATSFSMNVLEEKVPAEPYIIIYCRICHGTYALVF